MLLHMLPNTDDIFCVAVVYCQEATLNAAVTVELVTWFFIGECIGKGRIIGYKIPGAYHYH